MIKRFVFLLILAIAIPWFYSVQNVGEPKEFSTQFEGWDVDLYKTEIPYVCLLHLYNTKTDITYNIQVKWSWELFAAYFVISDGSKVGYITGVNSNVEIYYSFLETLNHKYKLKKTYNLK